GAGPARRLTGRFEDHDWRATMRMCVAVVGVCGSGKTTIVEALRERGYDAYVVGQEHSISPQLWAQRQPDHLLFLEATLETVRERRGATWPKWLYDLQQERLAHARAHASL